MAISLKTRTMLWGRAAQRCAFPNCRLELVKDKTLTDDESLVGEDCHIVARAENGPRGVLSLSEEDRVEYRRLIDGRDLYGNLILLCNVHHKLVDDQHVFHTIKFLLDLKVAHEEWVRASLQGFNETEQRDYEIYSSYVEDWIKKKPIENWDAWTSWVLGPDPQITKDIFDSLGDMSNWLFNRIWPKRYPLLESAFDNFRRVLNDFVRIFRQHAELRSDGFAFFTPRFYKKETFNPKYDEDLEEYVFYVDLLHDLVLEMTRATNYVCDQVRIFLDPTFRLQEGAFLADRSDDLRRKIMRPEYLGSQRTESPYEGLDKFLIARGSRDYWIGNTNR